MLLWWSREKMAEAWTNRVGCREVRSGLIESIV